MHMGAAGPENILQQIEIAVVQRMARAGGIRAERISAAIAVIHFEYAGADITHFELRVIAARDPGGVLAVAHEDRTTAIECERDLLAWLRARIRNIGRAAV